MDALILPTQKLFYSAFQENLIDRKQKRYFLDESLDFEPQYLSDLGLRKNQNAQLYTAEVLSTFDKHWLREQLASMDIHDCLTIRLSKKLIGDDNKLLNRHFVNTSGFVSAYNFNQIFEYYGNRIGSIGDMQELCDRFFSEIVHMSSLSPKNETMALFNIANFYAAISNKECLELYDELFRRYNNYYDKFSILHRKLVAYIKRFPDDHSICTLEDEISKFLIGWKEENKHPDCILQLCEAMFLNIQALYLKNTQDVAGSTHLIHKADHILEQAVKSTHFEQNLSDRERDVVSRYYVQVKENSLFLENNSRVNLNRSLTVLSDLRRFALRNSPDSLIEIMAIESYCLIMLGLHQDAIINIERLKNILRDFYPFLPLMRKKLLEMELLCCYEREDWITMQKIDSELLRYERLSTS